MPQGCSGTSIETVEQAGSTQSIKASPGESWRSARSWARDLFVKASRVLVHPHGFAGAGGIANYGFLVTTLLLSEETISHDQKRRPGRSDGMLPDQGRRI